MLDLDALLAKPNQDKTAKDAHDLLVQDASKNPDPDLKPSSNFNASLKQVLSSQDLVKPASDLDSQKAGVNQNNKTTVEEIVANNKVARYGLVTAEGLAYSVPGAFKAVGHDLSNPLELGAKVGMAATVGMAMKVILPKTGVGKAIVGGVMGYYMIKDAIKPLGEAYEEAGKARNMDEVHKAAQKMGDGLGKFAWDSYLGSKVGLKAEKWTGNMMEARLGTARYSNFEKAKVDFFSSDDYFVGRTLNRVVKPIDNLTDMISQKMVRKQQEPEVVLKDVVHKFQEVQEQNAFTTLTTKIHFNGMSTRDAKPVGFSQTLDLLTSGIDPRKYQADDLERILAQKGSSLADDVVAPTAGTIKLTAQTNEQMPFTAQARSIIGKDKEFKDGFKGEAPDANGTKITITDKDIAQPAAIAKSYGTKAEQELNADTVKKMAEMNRKDMAEWDDTRVLIEDAKENLLGPIHAATTPGYQKMDPGYILSRNQAVSIGNQIKTEKDLQYVMPLLSRWSGAANQHISKGLGETANYKKEFDLLAQEIHSTLVRNMRKNGIDPDAVLSSKNPPVFSISHDGGSGPHTMRQIDGVWNVDHVLYPRNMVGTRSTTSSGIYGHEIGHDQYGGILKFDESIRDEVIQKAVAKGLGARASEKVTVPGQGEMTKAELIENIFKAQADENTADIWGAAWTGHNGGGALGILLQSMRKGGQLETRNVFGKDFVSPENPLGFEVHAFDAIRPKIVASTMRARANGDQRTLDYAKALDSYADDASRPGDYVFANMDKPGETIVIPRKDLEAVIPHLIDAQMNTPLPALQGKTFGDILPDLPSHLGKMDTLADLMVDAVTKGKKPSEIPFDTSHYTINQVFGAGMPAALRLVSKGMDATDANKAVNRMSDYLRALYHDNDPHIDPLKPTTLQAIRLNSPKELVSGTKRIASELVDASGKVIGKQPLAREAVAERTAGLGGAVAALSVSEQFRKEKTESNMARLGDDIVSNANNAIAQSDWLKQKDRLGKDLTRGERLRSRMLEQDKG